MVSNSNGLIINTTLILLISTIQSKRLLNSRIIGSISLIPLSKFNVVRHPHVPYLGPLTFGFLIDIIGSLAQVYLIYPSPTKTPQIFLLFNEKWFCIASSFISYYRLQVSFLGIFGWQLAYVEYPSQETFNWTSQSTSTAFQDERSRTKDLNKAQKEVASAGRHLTHSDSQCQYQDTLNWMCYYTPKLLKMLRLRNAEWEFKNSQAQTQNEEEPAIKLENKSYLGNSTLKNEDFHSTSNPIPIFSNASNSYARNKSQRKPFSLEETMKLIEVLNREKSDRPTTTLRRTGTRNSSVRL